MIIAKLNLTEAAVLEFGVEISGSSDCIDNARFIIEGPDFGIICKCVEKADGTVVANIPNLDGKLAAGVYEARLELFIDGKIYVPVTETVELRADPEFNVFVKGGRSLSEENASLPKRDMIKKIVQQKDAVKNNWAESIDKVLKTTADDTIESEYDTIDIPPKAKNQREKNVDEESVPRVSKDSIAADYANIAPNISSVKHGTAPVEDWMTVAKRSITRPENAPKVAKAPKEHDDWKDMLEEEPEEDDQDIAPQATDAPKEQPQKSIENKKIVKSQPKETSVQDQRAANVKEWEDRTKKVQSNEAARQLRLLQIKEAKAAEIRDQLVEYQSTLAKIKKYSR